MGKPKRLLTHARKKEKEKSKFVPEASHASLWVSLIPLVVRARVQYDITQHPALAAQIPASLVDLLRTALESHRVALRLQQENADVLFNTAQVLTSLAEALSEGRGSVPESELKGGALGLLEEAVELFQRCLTLQEYQFSESQAQMEEMAGAEQNASQTEGEDTLMGDTASTAAAEAAAASLEASEDERWATIVEPLTPDTLLDTALAQLETLTVLCGLAISEAGSGLAWIEEYSTNLILNKISALARGTDRQREVALARANFICAFADASFKSGQMDLQTYKKEVFLAFDDEKLGDITNDPQILSAKAEALMSFCSAIADPFYDQNLDAGTPGDINSVRWNHLSLALDSLTMASKLPEARNVAKIHLARGDVEMLRFRLGQPPNNYEPAQKNSETLLKNAAVYYRGAAGVARNAGMKEETTEAAMKETVAKGLVGDELAVKALRESSRNDKEVLEEMMEEGLLDREWIGRVGI
ncbi:hypothetical protein GP486_006069 [Trichoglossum hirsutum]|uniref:Uncharacterized protein n=1 Tax=Trichoglossum hirsutum TaxID=265104 RepID=A0A9P8L816_9PEZI|nr:hypothetical protein GP486_006069 [Trichoglossum hirsutum]